MCNLYSLNKKRDAVARFFRVSHNRAATHEPLAAIFPGHTAPISSEAPMDERELVLRSWGFILLRDGYAPKRVTNTRDDKAHTKFWKDSFEKRLCLVPASTFCEPDEGKPARWHWFALKDGGDPRPPFAFAGIYRTWKGPIKKDGAQSRAGSVLLHDHADEDQYSTWLTGSPEDAFGLVKTSDPAMMEIVQSGFEKKDLPAAA